MLLYGIECLKLPLLQLICAVQCFFSSTVRLHTQCVFRTWQWYETVHWNFFVRRFSFRILFIDWFNSVGAGVHRL